MFISKKMCFIQNYKVTFQYKFINILKKKGGIFRSEDREVVILTTEFEFRFNGLETLWSFH